MRRQKRSEGGENGKGAPFLGERARGWVSTINLRGTKIFQKHGLPLAKSPDRLQTLLPSSSLPGNVAASESAILTRTFPGYLTRRALSSPHVNRVPRRVRVCRVWPSSGIASDRSVLSCACRRAWRTLAIAMAYFVTHTRARATPSDALRRRRRRQRRWRWRRGCEPLSAGTESKSRVKGRSARLARLTRRSGVSERKRNNRGELKARTERDEDWGLLSTHRRSLEPPLRCALLLPLPQAHRHIARNSEPRTYLATSERLCDVAFAVAMRLTVPKNASQSGAQEKFCR